jgi:hypothetical protein
MDLSDAIYVHYGTGGAKLQVWSGCLSLVEKYIFAYPYPANWRFVILGVELK